MRLPFYVFVLLAATGGSCLVRAARADEVIVVRTGQVVGVPGTCPSPDDVFTYNPDFPPACSVPMRGVAFTEADFAGARTGPHAKVIAPFLPYWIAQLSVDAEARWISWDRNPTCNGEVGSILYAVPFVVQTAGATVGDVSVCWAADDAIGDPAGGPNTAGVFVNELPLSPSFSGGGLDRTTCATQANVPLAPGLNYLYAYQRDLACTASGLILRATITVPSPVTAVPAAAPRRLAIASTGSAPAPHATLRYSLPTSGLLRMDVHDLSGRRVRTLLDAWAPAGVAERGWDGRSDAGSDLPAGAYFVRMRTRDGEASCRVMLAR